MAMVASRVSSVASAEMVMEAVPALPEAGLTDSQPAALSGTETVQLPVEVREMVAEPPLWAKPR